MTKIEWVRSPDGSQGITLNSKTGCQNHTPEGLCLGGLFPCYAFKLARGRLKPLYLANMNCPTSVDFRNGQYKPDADAYLDPFYPRWWPERLAQIKGIKKPTGIFLDDMSDWMGDYWPEEWTRAELQMMRDNPQHRIYTLTKQPQNLPQFSPFPDNAWVGVTVTNNILWNRAIENLSQVKASVKFISFEPLLSVVGNTIDREDDPNDLAEEFWNCGIDWLVIGAQTNPYKPPEIAWVREIVEAADKAGIPVFLKDNIRPLLIPEDCSRPNYLTEDIFWASEKAQLRQEMPETKERIRKEVNNAMPF